MFSLVLVVVLTTATTAASPQSEYTLAYKKSIEQEKPLMVMVGAEWCHYCNVLKETTIKDMKASGEFRDVSFAVVDRDAQPELAEQLLQGETMIPRIIMFTKSESGSWEREELKGYQPVQPVRSLIRRAINRIRG